MSEKKLFHGNNAAYIEDPVWPKRLKYWITEPYEAFIYAFDSAYKFNSHPVIIVHLNPEGAKFELTQDSRIYNSTKLLNIKQDPDLEIYMPEDLEKFCQKYLPDKLNEIQLFIKQLEKRKNNYKYE